MERDREAKILNDLSIVVSQTVSMAPIVAFYVTGLQTLPYPEKIESEKIPDRFAPRIVKDFVHTTAQSTVNIEALVNLLIEKGMITEDEWEEARDKSAFEFAERKRTLHRKYFNAILESLR